MIKIRVNDLFHKGATGIWIMDYLDEGGVAVADPVPLSFTRKEDGAFMLPEPTLEFSYKNTRDFFQGLCDELSRLGFAPNTDRLKGELDATKKHLDDMRRLSADLLGGVVKNQDVRQFTPKSGDR